MITINNQVYDGIIDKPMLDDILKHYGVKGMKWRKRKAKNLVDKGYPSAESNKSYNLNLKTMQLTDDHYAKANKATDKSKPLLTKSEKLRKLRKKRKNLVNKGYPSSKGSKNNNVATSPYARYVNGIDLGPDVRENSLIAGKSRAKKRKK